MAPQKNWLFQPTYNPLTHLQAPEKNTFPEVQLRIKDKKHLAHLKKNNHGILPAISCLVLGFHPTPKVPIFPAYHSTRLLYIKASFPPNGFMVPPNQPFL